MSVDCPKHSAEASLSIQLDEGTVITPGNTHEARAFQYSSLLMLLNLHVQR